MIKKVKNNVSWIYVISDLNGEKIIGTLYEKELQKTNKLDIDKLEKVPAGSNSLKSKVAKLDVDKLALVPVNLSKPSDVIKMMLLKRPNVTKWLKKLTLLRLLILLI